MHLDRVSSPTESALQQRREAAGRGVDGIEVASSIPPYDTSSASYFGSKTSMAGSDVQGYYSSSLPPDDMYESSDGRVSAGDLCLTTVEPSNKGRFGIWRLKCINPRRLGHCESSFTERFLYSECPLFGGSTVPQPAWLMSDCYF